MYVHLCNSFILDFRQADIVDYINQSIQELKEFMS